MELKAPNADEQFFYSMFFFLKQVLQLEDIDEEYIRTNCTEYMHNLPWKKIMKKKLCQIIRRFAQDYYSH